MEREAFRQRMQQYKQARENNPQLKYWDWKKYADGGTIDEDPPQSTSERPITNFDPKGDPYNPTYGYNPGAGYVSNSDPLGSLYYEDIINQYNTNYWNLPNPVIKQLDAKAKMQAKDAAVNRYITRRQPAGYDDFEYQINRNLTEIDYPTTRHELGHYVDFNLAKSSNPDYSNSMFAELKRDLSKQKNPLFPDKTDYYSKGTDYLQFATPGQYTKWFNKIPLLGTYPIVNKQFQNYEEDKDKARKQR